MTTFLKACVAMLVSSLTVGHLILIDAAAGIAACCVTSALLMHWFDKVKP